jgi:hypothetical protein
MQDVTNLLICSKTRALCHVALLPGKGRGLLANAFLRAGTLLLSDSPLALVVRGVEEHAQSFGAPFLELDQQLIHSSQLSRLVLRCVHSVVKELETSNESPTWNQLRVLTRPTTLVDTKFNVDALHKAIPASRHVFNQTLLSQLMGIVHMNTIGLEVPDASAIFAAASMINHSW